MAYLSDYFGEECVDGGRDFDNHQQYMTFDTRLLYHPEIGRLTKEGLTEEDGEKLIVSILNTLYEGTKGEVDNFYYKIVGTFVNQQKQPMIDPETQETIICDVYDLTFQIRKKSTSSLMPDPDEI